MRIRQVTYPAILIFAALNARAASQSVGFAAASGSFQLDSSRIWSNVTIFDGSSVEARTVPVKIHLADGSELLVAPASRVTVHPRMAAIEKGSGRLQSSTGYQLRARSWTVTPSGQDAAVDVDLRGRTAAAAAALRGKVLVADARGMPLAEAGPGKVVTLDDAGGGAPELTRIGGCVAAGKGNVLLTDDVSGVVFEIRGEGVKQEIGNRVEVEGTADAARAKDGSAVRIVRVAKLTRVQARACASVGSANRASPISHHRFPSRDVAIIGGVAVGATAGGLEAAGKFSSSDEESRPANSR